MPPLIIASGLVLVGVAAYAFAKRAIDAASDQIAEMRPGPREVGTLKRDPATGEYRLK